MKKAFLFLLAVACMAPAAFARDIDPVVSVAWLEANLVTPGLVILDTRAPDAYRAGHIPGAVNSVFSAWMPKRGVLNAELPDEEDLLDLITGAGIDSGSKVVIVETEGGGRYHFAARVGWTLKSAGLDTVAILDGGHAAWVAAGKALSTTVERATASKYTIRMRPEYIVSEREVLEKIGKSQFVDARSYDGYFGRTKLAFVSQFGHIPGALGMPKEWLLNEKGMLVPVDTMIEYVEAMGLDPAKEVIGYCDTGMGCALWWWILKEQLGFADVRIYDGSSEQLTKNPAVKYTKYTWR